MGSLSNLYISQSYQSLIHLGTNNTASATLIGLEDGLGNSIGVAVDTGGNLYISGTFSASLQEGYLLVGNGNGRTIAIPTSSISTTIDTSSLITSASFNAYTASTNIRLDNLELTSASVNTSISNINTYTQSNDLKWQDLGNKSGSWITESETGSFARYDVSNPWSANQNFTNISAVSASFLYVQTTYETASVIYSSGSNQFGDAADDTQTLYGQVKVMNALTASGLIYPIADNGAKSFIQTDGAGRLSLQYVDTIWEIIRAGQNVSKGTPLYISGSQGANPIVYAADAADPNKMPVTYVAGQNMTAGNTYNAIVLGLIEGINLTGYVAGDIVYVAEGGGWTSNLPSGSNSITQVLGVVTKGGNGGKGLVLNPGPAALPGLQTGNMWVGNGNNRAVSIPTSSFVNVNQTGSFATTGSNIFYGDQIISGSGTYGIDATNGIKADYFYTDTQGVFTPTIYGATAGFGKLQIEALDGVNINGHLTASLQQGYIWVGDSSARSMPIPTASFTNTASFEAYTGSNDLKWLDLGNKSGSWITETESGSFLITASFDNTTRNLSFTKGDTTTFNLGGFATTGSNVFRGTETFEDAAGNWSSLHPISGGFYLVARGSNSASAHISSSNASLAAANGLTNIVFKTNNNTADTILSGSSNIFTNPGAPTAGFKRYLTAGNLSLMGGIPQISGNMAFSPTITSNILAYPAATANPMTIRGPVSSSAYSISTNLLLGGALNLGTSAANHFQQAVNGVSIANNIIGGTFALVANRTRLTQVVSIGGNQIQGVATFNMNSSSIDASTSLFYGTNTINNNSTGSSRVSAAGNAVGIYQTNYFGTNTTTFSGSNDPNDVQDLDYQGGIYRSLIVGTNTQFVITGPTGSNSINNTGIIGNGLIVTGSSGNQNFGNDTLRHGSLFAGRWNADGTRNRTSENVFAIGTGTSNTARKTGFLIDSGSNTFIEGTLNVSGASTLNGNTIITGSLTLSSSAAIELNVIGNSQFTGSVSMSGSLIITGSARGNVVALSITSNTASMDLNAANYFTLTLADTATTHITATNIQPGTSATLVITTGTNSSASLAPTLLEPSGSDYIASNGSGKKDVLSFVAIDSTNMFVVSTKNMV